MGRRDKRECEAGVLLNVILDESCLSDDCISFLRFDTGILMHYNRPTDLVCSHIYRLDQSIKHLTTYEAGRSQCGAEALTAGDCQGHVAY